MAARGKVNLMRALDLTTMTRQQKVDEILRRFKVREDLYDYLCQRL